MRVDKKFLVLPAIAAMIASQSMIESQLPTTLEQATLNQDLRVGLRGISDKTNTEITLEASEKTLKEALAKAEIQLQEKEAKIRELEENLKSVINVGQLNKEVEEKRFIKKQNDRKRAEHFSKNYTENKIRRLLHAWHFETQATIAKVDPKAQALGVKGVQRLKQALFHQPLVFAILILSEPEAYLTILILTFKKTFYTYNQTQPNFAALQTPSRTTSSLPFNLFSGEDDAGLSINMVVSIVKKLDPKLNRPFNSWMTM